MLTTKKSQPWVLLIQPEPNDVTDDPCRRLAATIPTPTAKTQPHMYQVKEQLAASVESLVTARSCPLINLRSDRYVTDE
jgi:hypothetical protein